MREDVRRRLLVVEDDATLLELILTRLQLAGYQTFYARGGVEGLDRLRALAPHGLLLDINMPGLDGFGVLERMRSEGLHQRVRTLVLTARNQSDDVRRAIALGAHDILTKPFTDEQLIARTRRLVRPSRERPLTPDAGPPRTEGGDASAGGALAGRPPPADQDVLLI